MKYSISIILLGIGIAGMLGGMFFNDYISEIFLGLVAPLSVCIISIYNVKRVHSISPQKLTSSLTKSFLFKMIVFAIYFIIILGIYTFEPIPFVISFTGFFVLFYAIEAIFLHKLLQNK